MGVGSLKGKHNLPRCGDISTLGKALGRNLFSTMCWSLISAMPTHLSKANRLQRKAGWLEIPSKTGYPISYTIYFVPLYFWDVTLRIKTTLKYFQNLRLVEGKSARSRSETSCNICFSNVAEIFVTSNASPNLMAISMRSVSKSSTRCRLRNLKPSIIGQFKVGFCEYFLHWLKEKFRKKNRLIICVINKSNIF